MSHLLKRKDSKYLKKRKYLEDAQYKFDHNNNLYLTLPKFNFSSRNTQEILEKISRKFNKNISILETKGYNNDEMEDTLIIKSNEVTLDYQFKTQSGADYKSFIQDTNSDVSELNEEERENLYEKLKKEHQVLPKIIRSNTVRMNQIHNASPLSFSIPSDKNLLKAQVIETLPIIKDIYTLRTKCKIIDKAKSKPRLLGIDLFNYDKKKWEKLRLRESDKILININKSEERRTKQMSYISKGLQDMLGASTNIKQSVKFNSIKAKKDYH